MQKLLLSCTKNLHFCFNDIIYQKCDGIAIGSPLGSVLAEIVRVHLECTLIPKLTEHTNPWKKYVNDKISIIKETSVTHVLTVFNDF